jgi:hypothetical protein
MTYWVGDPVQSVNPNWEEGGHEFTQCHPSDLDGLILEAKQTLGGCDADSLIQLCLLSDLKRRTYLAALLKIQNAQLPKYSDETMALRAIAVKAIRDGSMGAL